MNENGKTQEELDVEATVNQNQQVLQPPVTAPQVPAAEAAPKKKPFIPPLLGAKSLGMSTLIGDNGKT